MTNSSTRFPWVLDSAELCSPDLWLVRLSVVKGLNAARQSILFSYCKSYPRCFISRLCDINFTKGRVSLTIARVLEQIRHYFGNLLFPQASKFKYLWIITRSDINWADNGFGGLEVARWPLVPKFAGSNLAEAVGFFRAKKKIPSTLSFGGEVKPVAPCRRFSACKRYLNVTWKSAFRQNSRLHFIAH
jgi:hypothetical protein